MKLSMNENMNEKPLIIRMIFRGAVIASILLAVAYDEGERHVAADRSKAAELCLYASLVAQQASADGD